MEVAPPELVAGKLPKTVVLFGGPMHGSSVALHSHEDHLEVEQPLDFMRRSFKQYRYLPRTYVRETPDARELFEIWATGDVLDVRAIEAFIAEHKIEPDAREPVLKPRAFDENGTPRAWWSDDFQQRLERHPRLRKPES